MFDLYFLKVVNKLAAKQLQVSKVPHPISAYLEDLRRKPQPQNLKKDKEIEIPAVAIQHEEPSGIAELMARVEPLESQEEEMVDGT